VNNEHDEQTRWLITYLETRFGRLEDRISSVAEGLDTRVRDSLEGIGNDYTSLEKRLNTVEDTQLRLSSQAGFFKNLLAFVGTAVLSLVGWLASTFIFPNGK
jgi:hypothetical protein